MSKDGNENQDANQREVLCSFMPLPAFLTDEAPGLGGVGPGQHLPLLVVLSQIIPFSDRGAPVPSLCSLCLYWIPVTCFTFMNLL